MDRESDTAEASFQRLMDTAPVMIWASGIDKLCTWFNKPWLDFTGRTMEQELGNGWAEGVHPDDVPRCLEIYSAHFDKRLPFRMEYRLQRADGAYRWILDTGVPRADRDDAFIGYIGSCIDINAFKQVERGLQRSVTNRQAALDDLDRLATTMAHEFKNILMGIQMSHAAIREAAKDPAILNLIDQAEASLAEGNAIIRGLLDAARHPTNLESVHVNKVIGESQAILHGAAGGIATLALHDLAARPDEVVVDPAQLVAALLNLVTNAREAMPEGGSIAISTRNMIVRPETLDEPELPPGRYIVVTVSDTGTGMDEGVLEHSLDPFFTTKDHGTGIGLSQVRAFVRHNGGIERITSEAGRGTSVRLYLPAAATHPT